MNSVVTTISDDEMAAPTRRRRCGHPREVRREQAREVTPAARHHAFGDLDVRPGLCHVPIDADRGGGTVFAMLVKGKLVVKVPGERAAAVVAAGRGESFDPGHGRVGKEWVAVQPGTAAEWRALAEEAREFVAANR